MAQRRIVVDFDDDGDDGSAGSPPHRPASAHELGAPAGGGAGKPADLLRSIQNMRLTLKRLEQQKQMHAVTAAPGAVGGPSGGASYAGSGGLDGGGMLDKQAALQMQVWQASGRQL